MSSALLTMHGKRVLASKRSKRFKTMQRRWLQVEPRTLLYFKNYSDAKPLGAFQLDQSVSIQPPAAGIRLLRGETHCFCVHGLRDSSGSVRAEPLFVYAETPAALKVWQRAIMTAATGVGDTDTEGGDTTDTDVGGSDGGRRTVQQSQQRRHGKRAAPAPARTDGEEELAQVVLRCTAHLNRTSSTLRRGLLDRSRKPVQALVRQLFTTCLGVVRMIAAGTATASEYGYDLDRTLRLAGPAVVVRALMMGLAKIHELSNVGLIRGEALATWMADAGDLIGSEESFEALARDVLRQLPSTTIILLHATFELFAALVRGQEATVAQLQALLVARLFPAFQHPGKRTGQAHAPGVLAMAEEAEDEYDFLAGELIEVFVLRFDAVFGAGHAGGGSSGPSAPADHERHVRWEKDESEEEKMRDEDSEEEKDAGGSFFTRASSSTGHVHSTRRKGGGRRAARGSSDGIELALLTRGPKTSAPTADDKNVLGSGPGYRRASEDDDDFDDDDDDDSVLGMYEVESKAKSVEHVQREPDFFTSKPRSHVNDFMAEAKAEVAAARARRRDVEEDFDSEHVEWESAALRQQAEEEALRRDALGLDGDAAMDEDDGSAADAAGRGRRGGDDTDIDDPSRDNALATEDVTRETLQPPALHQQQPLGFDSVLLRSLLGPKSDSSDEDDSKEDKVDARAMTPRQRTAPSHRHLMEGLSTDSEEERALFREVEELRAESASLRSSSKLRPEIGLGRTRASRLEDGQTATDKSKVGDKSTVLLGAPPHLRKYAAGVSERHGYRSAHDEAEARVSVPGIKGLSAQDEHEDTLQRRTKQGAEVENKPRSGGNDAVGNGPSIVVSPGRINDDAHEQHMENMLTAEVQAERERRQQRRLRMKARQSERALSEERESAIRVLRAVAETTNAGVAEMDLARAHRVKRDQDAGDEETTGSAMATATATATGLDTALQATGLSDSDVEVAAVIREARGTLAASATAAGAMAAAGISQDLLAAPLVPSMSNLVIPAKPAAEASVPQRASGENLEKSHAAGAPGAGNDVTSSLLSADVRRLWLLSQRGDLVGCSSSSSSSSSSSRGARARRQDEPGKQRLNASAPMREMLVESRRRLNEVLDSIRGARGTVGETARNEVGQLGHGHDAGGDARHEIGTLMYALLEENVRLRLRLNDYSEGLLAATMEKLEKFQAEFQEDDRAASLVHALPLQARSPDGRVRRKQMRKDVAKRSSARKAIRSDSVFEAPWSAQLGPQA